MKSNLRRTHSRQTRRRRSIERLEQRQMLAGDLDESFGMGGRTQFSVATLAQDVAASDVAVLPDGKVIVAGAAIRNNLNSDFAVARLHADGSVDDGFGSGQAGGTIVAFDQGAFSNLDEPSAIAVQQDGKVLIAGTVDVGNHRDFAIVRLTSDGQLDNTFSGDGRATFGFDLGAGDVDVATDIVIAADGKIIVVGYADTGVVNDTDFALMRLNSDGTLDTTFDDDGKVTRQFDLGFAPTLDRANSVAINGTNIYLAGQSDNGGGNNDFAIASFLPNGQPNNAFDSDGRVLVPFDLGREQSDVANSIAFDQSQRLVVAGTVQVGSGTDTDIAIARLNTDGTLDDSLSSDGKVVVSFNDGQGFVDEGADVAITSENKILVVGTADQSTPGDRDFAIAQLNPDGTLDDAFGAAGRQVVDFNFLSSGVLDTANAVAISSTGHIVVAGGSREMGQDLMAVARLIGIDQGNRVVPRRYNDVFAELQIQRPGNPDETVVLTGEVSLDLLFDGAAFGDANDDELDGLDEIPIDIDRIVLSATDSSLGRIDVSLNANSVSTGWVQETLNSNPGRLDVAPIGAGSVISNLELALDVDAPTAGLSFEGDEQTAFVFSQEVSHFDLVPGYVMRGNNSFEFFDNSGEPSGVTLTLNTLQLTAADFGDAPDPASSTGTGNYQTLLPQGPVHLIDPTGPILGDLVDRDFDGQPSLGVGDDENGVDDEDGVTFSRLARDIEAGVSVTVNNKDGFVNGWIDFNQDGDFNDPGEQVIDDALRIAGQVTISTFDIPADAVLGTTYARFRVSSANGSSPVGLSRDGEVEDYEVNIVENISLAGRAFDDANANGQHDANEEFLAGVLIHLLDDQGVLVDARHTESRDLDQNGSIDPATELGWFWFDGLAPSSYTVRQITPGGYSVGTPESGEYAVTDLVDGQIVADLDFANIPDPPRDYGDAPENYPVRLPTGANHRITSLFLGTAVSAEDDGQPTNFASGDSDDDGVIPLTDMVVYPGVNSLASFLIVASEAGSLDAWIDFNTDGDWLDPGEAIASSHAVQAGVNTLTFNVPASAVLGNSYARFRLSENGGLNPDGIADSGEVEDYFVRVHDGSQHDPSAISPDQTLILDNRNGQIFVSNANQELFSMPQSATQKLFAQLSHSNSTATIDFRGGTIIPDGGLNVLGSGDNDSLTILGDAAIDISINGDSNLVNFNFLDLSDPAAVHLTVDAMGLGSLAPGIGDFRLLAEPNDQITFTDAEEWRVDSTSVVDGKFIRHLTHPLLNGLIDVDIPFGWHNPIDGMDVNNSGNVSPGDALEIINEFDRRSRESLGTGLPDPATLSEFPDRYYDVTKDDRLTPGDALSIIDFLAERARSEQARGEQTSIEVVPSASLNTEAVDRAIANVASDWLSRGNAATRLDLPSYELPAHELPAHEILLRTQEIKPVLTKTTSLTFVRDASTRSVASSLEEAETERAEDDGQSLDQVLANVDFDPLS